MQLIHFQVTKDCSKELTSDEAVQRLYDKRLNDFCENEDRPSKDYSVYHNKSHKNKLSEPRNHSKKFS